MTFPEPVNLLEEAPLWLLWPLLVTCFLTAQEIGFGAGRYFTPPVQEGDSSGASHLLTSALALLGLLVAFTFSMAVERFDVRRVLVVQEANAVGTTYLRTQILPEPARTDISRLLLAYSDERLVFLNTDRGTPAEMQIAARTEALEARIWSALGAAIAAQPQATVNPSLLQTTNEMFDLAATDRAALDARIPITVLRTLFVYALITALIMGYVLSTGKRRYLAASATVFILFGLAISLILDIERPRSGTVQISDVPFARAAAGIRAMEAARQLPR